MKTIKFRDHLAKLVLTGEKTSTWRLFDDKNLSISDEVELVNWNTKEVFAKAVIIEVREILGSDTVVLHRGATGLGISGQKEIDIYIPVAMDDMENFAHKVEVVWGNPKSVYPEERIKWIRHIDGTYIEVMITNKDCKSWIDGEKFNNYLKQNPQALDEYRKLKEDAAGVTTREYYRRKIEFINEILEK